MPSGSKLQSLENLLKLRAKWSDEGKRVVWTNGCFDLLHVGHVRSLRDAKALGDILVVGLNSDASVRAIKGPTRPVVDQDDRAELLSALEPVDCVTIFDETEPSAILAIVKPDIHCKGAEYADDKRPVPERAVVEAYGGRVCFLPLHEGRSTTAMLQRAEQLR